jgi:hypothetical protein
VCITAQLQATAGAGQFTCRSTLLVVGHVYVVGHVIKQSELMTFIVVYLMYVNILS